MMYRCELINNYGMVVEKFFRTGTSKSEVLEGLEMFQWPEGSWIITEA
jgi:hypothetical protein